MGPIFRLALASSTKGLSHVGSSGGPRSLTEALPVHHSIEYLAEGWSGFADGWLLLDMCVVMLLAVLLGGLIAYHPSVRRGISNLEHIDQPKTLLIYAVVAAVVALIVQVQPAMAFVIFGIGGLLRFRTKSGDAKDTGRVILVTVVGLCCGLKIYVVAIPATIIGWLLIYFLERELTATIKISGVSEGLLQDAARAHRKVIQAAGFTIVREKTHFGKREVSFVVKAADVPNRERLEADLEALPAEVRGVVDWERV